MVAHPKAKETLLSFSSNQPAEETLPSPGELLEKCWGIYEQDLELQSLCLDCDRVAEQLKANQETLRRESEALFSVELQECFDDFIEGIDIVLDILQDLPKLAAEEKWDEFRVLLEDWARTREAVKDAREDMVSFFEDDIKVCPKCQAEHPHFCEECKLVTLYPAPLELELLGQQSCRLPETLAELRNSVFRILDGGLSLQHLSQQLLPLSNYVQEIREHLVQNSETETSLQLAMEGVSALRAATESHEMQDLIKGWNFLYRAFQTLDQHLDSPQLVRA